MSPSPESAADNADRLRLMTREVLVCAVEAWSNDPVVTARPELVSASGTAIRASVRSVCAAARAHGMRADQLLILVKAVWSELPGPGHTRITGTDVLARVVSLCIQEYYAPERVARPPSTPP